MHSHLGRSDVAIGTFVAMPWGAVTGHRSMGRSARSGGRIHYHAKRHQKERDDRQQSRKQHHGVDNRSPNLSGQ